MNYQSILNKMKKNEDAIIKWIVLLSCLVGIVCLSTVEYLFELKLYVSVCIWLTIVNCVLLSFAAIKSIIKK